MTWFNFLKAEGYFDPDKNPEPIQVGDGFQVPYWEALSYLEKLSLQIKDGKETELTNELINVIKKASEQPKDNYRTWYLFIKILANIPNENIPIQILNFIPIWFSGRFDTMLQTSELCERLLPKFLSDNPTKDDIEKVELILHYLFQIERITNDPEETLEGEGNSFYSRVYLHFLSDKFNKNDLIPKVAKYCSDKFILELGRTIKLLLLDYPRGIQTILKDDEKEYEIKVLVNNEDLLVSSKSVDDENSSTATISGYEDLNEDELRLKLLYILKQQGISYIPTNEDDDTFRRIIFSLNNDLFSAFGFTSIRKLDDKYSHSDKTVNVFSLIFRDFLNEKAKQNPKEAISLLVTFCQDKKYRIPFFKRVALYVICENWPETNSLFWDLLNDDDKLHLFSNYKYQKELFELLEKNQRFLTGQEKAAVQKIIDIGEQGENIQINEERRNYWQLRWYSALKDTAPFKERYLQISKSLNITSDYFEKSGELQWRSGSISPLSKEDLLQKSNIEIVDYIKTFQPKDRWEEPNIDGLSDILGAAVEEQPAKFSEEIELYLDIGYVYSYRMLNALSAAWKKQKSFDWKKVLHYCAQTLKSDKFYSGQLKTENDSWNATPDWVVGSIAHLLTDGMQNDKNAFDISLLPVAKEIIQIASNKLKVVDDFKGTNMDYPTYSLNSTAGKVLRALLDYSLRRARNLFKQEDKAKWEPEIQELFKKSLQQGILDGHILEGMYFQQFYFLDKDWITRQVEQHYQVGDNEWLAFMGGFAFGSPPFNKDLYSLFYPHYERAIESNIKLKNYHSNGLVRHLTTFYFWGYETLSSQKLLFKFLNKSPQSEIQELIRFVWQQESYPKTLTVENYKEFKKILFELWVYLIDKYENSQIEEEIKTLATLVNWIVFIPELDDTYTNLILKSSKHVDKTYSTHKLLENLVALKAKGIPADTAKYIGKIITSLNFREYIAGFDQDFIKELVIFLFIHGQKQVASDFCNKMASVHQMFFLREIYEDYSK